MTHVVAQLHGTGVEPAIAALGAQLGLPVRPLHPGTTDPGLGAWLHVLVPADRDPEAVVAALLADPTVAAAYVKPPDAAP
jgi:hypothetical protein